MYYGADYYPEHWPRERWPEDAKLMKEAGINLIRVAEFAWAKLEPEEGRWDFEWLDDALDVFYKEGIQVVMCTPTATPPKWLMDKHPEIYKINENGLVEGFGSRRHYCYNNDIYKAYTEQIVTKIAKRYGKHPAVAAWQIDNEFTCGDGLYCYCENCRQKFIKWLQKRYGSLDALNKAWGTVFWSQTYTDWQQIIVPRKAAASFAGNNGHNPGLNLDYSRFQSDSVAEYCALQSRIIRQNSNAVITHNVVSELYDYYKLSESLDIVTYDNYPKNYFRQKRGDTYYDPAFAMDIERGAKNKNIWVMEQQSGPAGWNALGSTPRPGKLKKWTYQAMAHGAEAIVYFRWRACLFGTEQYWYGILDHDGIPRRRYREIREVGLTFPKLCEYNTGSRVAADILIIRSFEQQWSHTFQEHSGGFHYRTYIRSLYRGLYERNYNVDISSENTDFSGYKLVVAPAFNLMDDRLKKKFEDYVAEGGNLVVTFRSGTRHMDNSMTEETLPGYFRELAGIEVEEFDSITLYTAGVSGVFGTGEASIWADIIEPVTAQVIASYTSEYYAGRAAVTVNQFGRGRCYYVGCDLDEEATGLLLNYIACECGAEPGLSGAPEGVEVVKKYDKNGDEFFFLMNFSDGEQKVEMPYEVKEIADGTKYGKMVKLPLHGSAAVVKAE